MSNPSNKLVHQYWLEISDITIFDAAWWMVTKSDPLLHDSPDPDQDYSDIKHGTYIPTYSVNKAAEFCERDNEYSDYIRKKVDVIESAIRANSIRITATEQPDHFKIGSLDRIKNTHIIKTDWIEWCQHNGYAELADLFRVPRNASQPSAAKDEPTMQAKSSSANDLDSTSMVYWRVVLFSNIMKIDESGKASCRDVIKYLRSSNNKRIPDEGSVDELHWIDDYGSTQIATKKTVSNAISDARKQFSKQKFP